MTVIAETAESHGGEAIGHAFANEGVQVIEHQPDVPLRLGVTVDENVACPEPGPLHYRVIG